MIRSIWKSYREIEDSGLILPVRTMNVVYHKPALYDELLVIKTLIKDVPKVKFRMYSEIYNANGDLINEAEVVLGFMSASTGKPARVPDEFVEILTNLYPFED